MLDLSAGEIRRYYRAALQHLEVAELLAAQTGRAASGTGYHAIYIAGYAAECLLKAVILTRVPRGRHRDVAETVLKQRIGHDLDIGRQVLRERGIVVPNPREGRDPLREISVGLRDALLGGHAGGRRP